MALYDPQEEEMMRQAGRKGTEQLLLILVGICMSGFYESVLYFLPTNTMLHVLLIFLNGILIAIFFQQYMVLNSINELCYYEVTIQINQKNNWDYERFMIMFLHGLSEEVRKNHSPRDKIYLVNKRKNGRYTLMYFQPLTWVKKICKKFSDKIEIQTFGNSIVGFYNPNFIYFYKKNKIVHLQIYTEAGGSNFGETIRKSIQITLSKSQKFGIISNLDIVAKKYFMLSSLVPFKTRGTEVVLQQP